MPTVDIALAHYRGLIYKTATLQVGVVEEDFDDVVQILTVKVWRAILSFDPARSNGKTRDSYVFACMTCAVKDLRKRKRRNLAFIEELVAPAGTSDDASGRVQSRDSFDMRHGLVDDADTVFAEVEDEPLPLPSTLTAIERKIVTLLVADWKQSEAARELGLDRREMEKAMRAIRAKMADWRPASSCELGEPQPAIQLAAA